MKKGMFITLEGIDGCGKSTLAQNLAATLKAQGRSVLLTKEPGGSKLGVAIREILHEQPEPLEAVSEFLLFAADRAEHFRKIIIPALDAGTIVISDRCADSSVAYQGYARGLDRTFITYVNAIAMAGIVPTCTIFIRIDPAIAFERLSMRGNGKLTSIESRGLNFMQRAQQGFEQLFEARSNVIYLEGNTSQNNLLHQVMATLDQKLGGVE